MHWHVCRRLPQTCVRAVDELDVRSGFEQHLDCETNRSSLRVVWWFPNLCGASICESNTTCIGDKSCVELSWVELSCSNEAGLVGGWQQDAATGTCFQQIEFLFFLFSAFSYGTCRREIAVDGDPERDNARLGCDVRVRLLHVYGHIHTHV